MIDLLFNHTLARDKYQQELVRAKELSIQNEVILLMEKWPVTNFNINVIGDFKIFINCNTREVITVELAENYFKSLILKGFVNGKINYINEEDQHFGEFIIHSIKGDIIHNKLESDNKVWFQPRDANFINNLHEALDASILTNKE
jgi:hypothetical protein